MGNYHAFLPVASPVIAPPNSAYVVYDPVSDRLVKSENGSEFFPLTSGPVTIKSGAYTAILTDETIIASGAPWTLGLPPASMAAGQLLVVINIGTGTITIDADGSETINGALTLALSTQYQGVILKSDGSAWYVVAATSAGAGGGSGTVTTISGVAANGVSWSIANPTTTPALTLIPNYAYDQAVLSAAIFGG